MTVSSTQARSASEGSTLVACLTPPGRSALATLAVRGPRAWGALQPLFRLRDGSALPDQPRTGRFWLGRLGTDVADEVVLAVKQTQPPWIELHTHGGREVVRFLLDLLQAHGLVVCTWQELLHHTEGDSCRTQAAIALAEATTVRTASILLDQYHGAFDRAWAALGADLDRGNLVEAAAALEVLHSRIALGRHLTQPWRVVVAGAPNVGKSSLVNALAGYQRSVVSATPGTTRDVVTTRIALDGFPIELADTAGLRTGGEHLEEQGMSRARETAAAADLCLWVLDASAPPVWPSVDAGAVRLVINKVDLPAAWSLDEARDAVRVSARTGEGVPALGAALVRWLVPEPPPPGAAVPCTSAQVERIEEARRALEARRPS